MARVAFFSRSTRVLGVSPRVPEPTLESWLRGVREAMRVATHPRFSIFKARQFIAYAQATSTFRQVIVVCLSPLASLLVSIAMPLIPLQDPMLGVRGNPGYFVHLTITIGLTAVGSILTARDLMGITRDEYSNVAVAVVTALTTALLVAMFAVMGLYWRFPVPFSTVIVYVPWLICISFAHIVTLRGRLASRRLRNHLLFFLPSLSVQVSQLVIYPAYSALFNASGPWVQAMLIGVFPVLKFVLKKNIYIMNHYVSDHARDEAVTAVEISASMYQAMIVQGTPSPLMTGLVIAVDVVLGVVDIKHLVSRHTVLPDVELVHAGMAILQRDTTTKLTDEQLQRFATRTTSALERVRQTVAQCRSRAVAPRPAIAVVPPEGPKSKACDERILTQSLEMLQSIETLVLVEYLEVVVPTLNAIYVVVASQLPSAVYNARLRSFVGHDDRLVAALANMVLYSMLQFATLVAVAVVVRTRYGLSPLAQTAFALEKHFWATQCKLISWLPTILAFSIAHYGVDFTFKFDFRKPPIT